MCSVCEWLAFKTVICKITHGARERIIARGLLEQETKIRLKHSN